MSARAAADATVWAKWSGVEPCATRRRDANTPLKRPRGKRHRRFESIPAGVAHGAKRHPRFESQRRVRRSDERRRGSIDSTTRIVVRFCGAKTASRVGGVSSGEEVTWALRRLGSAPLASSQRTAAAWP
eukprot:2084132-Prymnesium_polylepis.1